MAALRLATTPKPVHLGAYVTHVDETTLHACIRIDGCITKEKEEKPNVDNLTKPRKPKSPHCHVPKSQSKLPPTESFKRKVPLIHLLLSQFMSPHQLNQTKKF